MNSIRLDTVQVITAEDSQYVIEPIVAGLRHLVGVPDITSFWGLDEAFSHINSTMDRSRPTVAILDNNTPPSNWTGYDLATHLLTRKQDFPHLFVVTISSSDMGIVTDRAGEYISELQSLGGEFWAKHAESHLMTLWIGDMLRSGIFQPRSQWLLNLGIDPGYRSERDGRLPEDKSLMILFNRIMSKAKEGDGSVQELLQSMELSRNFFLEFDSREVLTRLGFNPTPLEGNRRQIER